MVWYGMVWCGLVWYGVVRYGTVWYGHVFLVSSGMRVGRKWEPSELLEYETKEN